ncbi:hypothetical protein Plhal703r1_c03g0014471 [Plasmopara halstedii]
MDFHGCFVPGHSQSHGVSSTEIATFAAMLSDFEPLSLSEEEIDYILDIIQAPVVQTETVL